MEVVGIPVLITRDKDSKIHAFRNVCSHRGAPLAGEEIGIEIDLHALTMVGRIQIKET